MLNARMMSCLAAVAVSTLASAKEPEALVRFSGGIGVDPLTAAGTPSADVLNTVRGINPGGRAWVIRKLSATIGTDGSINAEGKGLLFSSGEVIGTRGPVAAVGASLFCGDAGPTAARFDSPIVPLDAFGNFSIRGALTLVGLNSFVMPASCANPVLLIRSGNGGVLGGWFAAGIPADSDD